MPRERLSANGGTVEIAWGKDQCTIQLATTIPDGLERIQKILAEGGLKLVDVKTGNGAGSAQLERVVELLDGWHTHLDDRGEVNRLIRILKTGRDQSFGKDE